MDTTQRILELLQESALLSFRIENPYIPTDNDMRLIALRASYRAEAEALAVKVARMPVYIPTLPPINPPLYRDLIAEHNARFILARLSVLDMKVQRWNKKTTV